MNKLFKKTLKGFLIATFVATAFSTIQNAFAHEGAYTQTVLYSKYDVPYLALTAEEVRRIAGEDLVDLVSDRANRICQNRDYHSALDFDLETGVDKTSFYFDDEVVEVEGKWKPVALAIELGAVWPIFGVGFYKFMTNQAISSALSTAISGAIIYKVTYFGTTVIAAKRMQGTGLEGQVVRKYLYFTSIDCLEAKGVSDEKIAETKLRYTCNVLQDNNLACNKASVREVSCLVNLSSKDDSLQICRDLNTNIQDDKEFQCAVADIAGYKLSEVCSL